MPLCGGDVPSGKGGTNAGGARRERQKPVCLHEAACCSLGWYLQLSDEMGISENIHCLWFLQDVSLPKYERQGSHFFLTLAF